MPSSALFVGRFQPLHNGHLAVIKQILEKHDQIIIVIGSAEKNYIKNDPLTAGERLYLIDKTLKSEGISREKYLVVPVRNINNYALWVNHINIYIPEYDHLYTGSKLVKACYLGKYNKQHRKNKIGPKIVDLERIDELSASSIRELIAEENTEWKKHVPQKVAELLETWDIPARMKIIKNTTDKTFTNNSY